MTTKLLLFTNTTPKMEARKMLFFKAFCNASLRRGDDDPLTGEYGKLMRLEDGRTVYDAEMLAFAQLVLDGKVVDESSVRLLRGATIEKNEKGEPCDILIAEAALVDFDGVELFNNISSETMQWVAKLRPDIMNELRGAH